MSTGAALRDRGLEQVRQASLFDPWPRRALAAIEELARTRQTFTAEDLREMVGDPERPSQMGMVFRQAAKRELIEPAGIETSNRKERRASSLRTWRRYRTPALTARELERYAEGSWL